MKHPPELTRLLQVPYFYLDPHGPVSQQAFVEWVDARSRWSIVGPVDLAGAEIHKDRHNVTLILYYERKT